MCKLQNALYNAVVVTTAAMYGKPPQQKQISKAEATFAKVIENAKNKNQRKMRKAPLLTYILLFGSLLFLAFKFPYQPPQTQPKQYTVSMPVNEWELVAGALNNCDDVAVNAKKQLIEKIGVQIRAQLAADTTKKK